jgi:hypothetical protein
MSYIPYNNLKKIKLELIKAYLNNYFQTKMNRKSNLMDFIYS